MSWDIFLNCPHCGRSLPVENHTEGGTYAVGGTDAAILNVTYNYGKHFREGIGYTDGFREWLDGKRASEVAEQLTQAVAQLGTQVEDDYWQATAGNAGHALSILLGWARKHPDGVFEVV